MKTIYRKFLIGLLLVAAPTLASAMMSPTDSPLFLTNQVQHNTILALDDSGSMDSEVLFPTYDGVLWLNYTGIRDFKDRRYLGYYYQGRIVFGPRKGHTRYMYLFPNGAGAPARVYHYYNNSGSSLAVPPIWTLGFARSSEYNKLYYNPTVTYDPWPGYPEIDPTRAPSDPYEPNIVTTDLTQRLALGTDASTHDAAKQFVGWPMLRIPEGTEFCVEYPYSSDTTCQSESNWMTNQFAIKGPNISSPKYLSIRYYPAHYYVTTSSSSASYQVGTDNRLSEANYHTGNCSAPPNPRHYDYSLAFPRVFTSTGEKAITALGPDGKCLVKHDIDTNLGSDGQYSFQMRNFANWYSYYRKRSLTTRAAVLKSLENSTDMRIGMFGINYRYNVTMYDTSITTEHSKLMDQVVSKLYNTRGSTPNRLALDHAGKQYLRTDRRAPITDYCQKNFALQFTDGFAGPQRNWTAGNADGTEGAPYADNYSTTLGDTAMYYYKKNLRPDLKAGGVKVPADCSEDNTDKRIDCNTNLHMNTYTVGLGAKGTIFGVSHFNVADAYANPPVWPSIAGAKSPRQIDDLYHAAVNGRGNIYNGDTPEELSEALIKAMRDLTKHIGSSSKVSFNSGRLSANSMVYLASFSSYIWTGKLSAYRLNSTTGDIVNNKTWSADEVLDQRDFTAKPRTVISYRNDTDKGIPFSWGDLSSPQRNDLKTGTDGSLESDEMGKRRLDYLTGDRDFEGSLFRVRANLLGDIVHSSPVYIGTPEANWPDIEPFPTSTGKRYSDFVSKHHNRTEAIWVGANDGALHAFNSSRDQSGGEELLAYIPSSLFSTATREGLHFLSDPDYTHRFYVDGTPTVTDAFTSGPDGKRRWRTVVVGNLRGGGRSLFAIDASDPSSYRDSSNAAQTVMWEFSNSDDSDFGVVSGQPSVAMSNASVGDEQRWIVVSSGGYNGSSDKPHLFINFLDPDLSDGIWTPGGSDYLKIKLSDDLGVTTSPPAVVDLDKDGTADRIYVGDTSGKLWVIDISGPSPSNWAASSSRRLLFTSAGTAITTEPLVVEHPTLSIPLVVFGTGKYLELSDVNDTTQQAIYAIADKTDNTKNLDPNDLLEQSISEISHGGNLYRTLTSHKLANKHYGWKIVLNNSLGERVVTHASVRGLNIYLNTLIPTTGACDSGGEGWLMVINLENGGEPLNPAFDADGDGVVDKTDQIARPDGAQPGPGGESNVNPSGVKFNQGIPSESGFLGDKQYTPGTKTSTVDGVEVRQLEKIGGAKSGRLSWQEKMH